MVRDNDNMSLLTCMTTPSRLQRILHGIDRFFFRKISAQGFGLMRIGWALTAFLFLLAQWNDITMYYSNEGIIPSDMTGLITRTHHRFTLLHSITEPSAVFTLYLLLLFTLLCSALGIFTRATTILSTILLFSFHERDPYTLGGGDTVLRHLGFLLSIAPCLSAFTLDRAHRQWQKWKRTGMLLPVPHMSIWPWRLLLWQLIIIYGASLWYKSLGDMWWSGTAAVSALHHPTFVRWPLWFMDYLSPFAVFMNFFTLFVHIGWVSLLIPEWLTEPFPRWTWHGSRRRLFLMLGAVFHGSILIIMDAGSFSLAMMAGYAGLLLEEDFALVRNWFSKHWYTLRQAQGDTHITVLYDGRCGFCKRSTFWLTLCDHLHRLKFVNFWNEEERKNAAPNICTEQLNRAMHIVVPSSLQKLQTYSGFDAFRELAAHLPPFWILLPFLYVPGIAPIGRCIYAWIAKRRITPSSSP